MSYETNPRTVQIANVTVANISTLKCLHLLLINGVMYKHLIHIISTIIRLINDERVFRILIVTFCRKENRIMTILYVDDVIDGHHMPYLNGIINKKSHKCILLNSQRVDGVLIKQYSTSNWPTKSFLRYLKFIYEIKKIAEKEKVDIIHFLTMDSFARFFGIGLSFLSDYILLGTYHKFPSSKMKRLSMKIISNHLRCVIVHSEYLSNRIKKIGIVNCKSIEYPCFEKIDVGVNEAREFFNITNSFPVIGCIGETRYDKGLDILLDALDKIGGHYNLLISGKASYYTVDYILEKTKMHKNVYLNLHYLSDDEYGKSIIASDIIVLPYRKVFNGASGPLSDGVFYNKTIIGPNHGNIGFLIKKYELGFTFKTEDHDSLASIIDFALSDGLDHNLVYRKYQRMLDPKYFHNSYQRLYLRLVKTNDKV